VVQPHPHVLDRIAGDHTLLHGLDHALLHRRDEPGRDHPTLDLIDELEALSGLPGLDLNAAVAKLSPAARLLLVAAVSLGRLANRLLVGNPRRLELDLGSEPLLQPPYDHLH